MQNRIFLILSAIFFVSNAIARIRNEDIKNNLLFNNIGPVSYFVNHKAELEKLKQNLEIHKRAAIVGMSGMGKTQLIRSYIKENINNYKLILVFDFNVDLDEQFIRCNRKINEILDKNDIPLSLIQEKAKGDLFNYLLSTKDWLLVIDNIKVKDKRIHEIYNWEHNGHIIVGTQSSQELNDLIKLSFLNVKDSKVLAEKILGSDDTTIMNKLVETYKGYPVMIVQAAKFLANNKHLSVEEYQSIINKSENPVSSHLKFIFEKLTLTSKAMLCTIASINNQSFSKNLLKKLIKSENTFIEDLNEITNLGLISDVSDKKKNVVFEMHDLIKDNILTLMDNKTKQEIQQQVINSMSKMFKGDINNVRNYFNYDQTLVSNLEILLKNSNKNDLNILEEMELRKNLII